MNAKEFRKELAALLSKYDVSLHLSERYEDSGDLLLEVIKNKGNTTWFQLNDDYIDWISAGDLD